MTTLLLCISLLSQTSVDNPDWQNVLAECISGDAIVSKSERQLVVAEVSLDDDEATRTAKLACIYFSTARVEKPRYENNTAESLSTLLDLAKSPRLTMDELGLISQIVCLSIDDSSAGKLLEKELWNLRDRLPIDKQGVVISALRLAAWENVEERVAKLNAIFGSDESNNEDRESIILAIGGALVQNNLEVDRCLKMFSELHQLRVCTDTNDSQMMKLLSEHVETEKARSALKSSTTSDGQIP